MKRSINFTFMKLLKNLVILLIFLVSCDSLFSQITTPPEAVDQWTKPNYSYGVITQRGLNWIFQGIPTSDTIPTTLPAYDLGASGLQWCTSNHTLYVYQPENQVWAAYSSGGGGDSTSIWGRITGTLSNQNDLQDALDLKFDAADFNSTFDTRFATKSTTNLTEGTNLYYTNARARGAISLTTIGTGVATYDNSTGVLNVPTNSATVSSVGMTGDNVIYNTAVTGSPVTTSGTLVPVLKTQSAYTLFGRGSGTGAWTSISSIDSNWIPTLHSQNYYNTKYVSLIDSLNIYATPKEIHDSLSIFYYPSATSYIGRSSGYNSAGGVAPTTMGQSVLIGSSAGGSRTSITNSVFIGGFTGMGFSASSNASTGSVWLGYNGAVTTPDVAMGDIKIGYLVGQGYGSTYEDIIIGESALSRPLGGTRPNTSHNIGIGAHVFADAGNTLLNFNTAIGNYAGTRASAIPYTPGFNNIMIGNGVTVDDGATNTINIGRILYGTGMSYDSTSSFAIATPISGGKIGVGIQAPTNTLHVNGDVRISTITSGSAGTDSVLVVSGGVVKQIAATYYGTASGSFVPTTRTISTTAPLTGGGDLSANRTFAITQASTSTDGYLSSTDWNTFNGKQAALGFTAENVANKATSFVTLNNTLYPTTQAVANYVTGQGYLTSESDASALKIASNLSDLANTTTARSNLGLGSSATHASGDYLLAANNLSDVTASTARTNLGATTVGGNIFTATNPSAVRWIRVNADNTITFRTAAETASDIGALTSYTETDPGALLKANNLSDLVNAGTARTNLGATTIGGNLFTLTNPSAVTFPRFNADNTVTARSAANLKTDLSLDAVENTALSTWAGSTNIVSLGTITTGTWNGSAITATYLPATIPYTSQTNTYTAGRKQIFGADATNAGLNFAGVSADPSSLTDGDMWYNSTSNVLKYRANSTTRTVVNNDGTQTLSNKTLTAPVVASIVNTGTQTVPTVTGTLMSFASSTITSSATPAPAGDSKRNELYITALGAAATFSAPSGTPTNGNELIIRVKDDATARGLSFNAIYRATNDTPLPTTTATSKTMYMKFIYNSTDSKWDMIGFSDRY